MKYVVMTGGTMSGLGKGTSMSSLGVLLKANNISLTCIKIDPYLNVDAGTMSPYEHGEVYVLNDGGEVDLDLGNYERFLNLTLSKDHNITTGKIFENVISKERKGEYLGKTVQIVPMVTDLIQDWIIQVSTKAVDRNNSKPPEICLIEVGGTVGDIESAVYLEALQQLKTKVGPDNFCLCHLSYVPTIGSNNEQKTKPTQHSVKTLREAGLSPDIVFCRCTEPLNDFSRQKIAMFSQLKSNCVVSVTNCDNLYKVPLVLDQQHVAQLVFDKLKIPINNSNPPNDFSLDIWKKLSDRYEFSTNVVRVGIVGKYIGLIDSYLSVMNALKHSSMEANLKLEVVWIDSSQLEDENSSAWDLIKRVDGVLCPGGFGDRGINGKCLAARYCRNNKIPYFGICMGMQTAVIDIYREFVNPEATSEEFITESTSNIEESQNNTNLAIISMPEFIGDNMKGGTMRLGRRITIVGKDCLTYSLYDKQEKISERHRHRYEVNPKIVPKLESLGLKFVGKDETGTRMEICELDGHPFFLCVQFHPEFNSLPLKPSPCFLAFILSCKGMLYDRLNFGGGCLKPGKPYFN